MVFSATSLRLAIVFLTIFLASSVLAATDDGRLTLGYTVVLLDFSYPVSRPFWQDLTTELGDLDIGQSLRAQILWMRREQFHKCIDCRQIIQVSVQGNCMSADGNAEPGSGPLGWVYVVGDQIQPFAFVNCNRLRYLLRTAMRDRARREQQNKMARALARIIKHELTHILTQDSRHSVSGLQKAYLTQADLLREAFP